MIALRELDVEFVQPNGERVSALRELNLDIPTGQFVTVIGSNGSGKSTLLNVVAGRVLPLRGRIDMEGEDVTRLPEHRRARVIGRVFQDPYMGTCAGLTVAENLRLAETRGVKRGLRIGLGSAARSRYQERLEHFGLGLESRLDALAGGLSGGQRQALTLLMAVLREPRILLLDEPTAALDPGAERKLVGLVRQITTELHVTTLMITHSMDQALELGQRTIMVHHGRVVMDVGGSDRAALTTQSLLDRFATLHRE